MGWLIRNYENLAITEERKKLFQLIDFGIEETKPEKLIKKSLKITKERLFIQDKVFDLTQFNKIVVLGIGKGSASASLALAEILGNHLTQGMVIDIQKPITSQQSPVSSFRISVGSHPLPTKKNYLFSRDAVSILKKLDKNDLLITVVCGGGSKLFCYPISELKGVKLFKYLTARGVNIKEINTVRKHLSLVKGGGLAKIVYPATVIGLIFSDVPGNDISVVASGPTVYDKTTKKDAGRILKKYLCKEEYPRLSASISALVRVLKETPKDEKYFEKVHNFLISSNKSALEKMIEKAKKLGLKARIYKCDLEGEARKAGKILLSKAKKGELILVGGETTVKLKGKPFGRTPAEGEARQRRQGKGGRNQELVLGALRYLKPGEIIISIASDGWDNTEAAGAIGDQETLKKAKKLNLNINKYLDNNDSFHFFSKTGDLIFTGHTGINVSDLMLVYKK